MSECCCGNGTKNILLFACSGGANVAEISDRAARRLMAEGKGQMFCLAGLGACMENMIQQVRDADLNVLIDGCQLDCAKKIFDRHGLTNYVQVKVTDLGIRKARNGPCTEEQISAVVNRVNEVLAVTI